jgi:protein-disulfide isomerase
VELGMDYGSTGYKNLVKSLEPELRKRVADGKARLVLRDLALGGQESDLAASYVRCVADQSGPAWLAHDILAYNSQGAGSGMWVMDTLLRVAAQLGLSIRQLDTCLSDPAVAQAVKDETATGTAQGLKGGPTILVLKGGQEIGRFAGTIDPTKVLAAIDGAK